MFSDHTRNPIYNPYILYTNDFLCVDLPEDAVVVERDNLNADDARALVEFGIEHSKDVRRVFIFTKEINVYAQNALLKLFEEPPHNVVFFLVLPEKISVLDTLKSRCHALYAEKSEDVTERVRRFRKMSEAKRLEELDSIWKGCSENGNKSDAISFLDEIEVALHKDVHGKKVDNKVITNSNDIVNRTREVLNSPMANKNSLYSLAFIW